jgi:outer membrane receptor protein involved in Fe transport
VHVRTNSRGEAEISVRGSESRQVAILLDGVPLTLGWDARTDVSVLPAGAIQELNLVRGVSSVLHGPNVLGGVVEVGVGRSTRVPLRRVGGELTLQAVKLVDPATTLSREPENLPERSGNVHARLPLPAGWTLGAEARYTGSQFCQDLNTGADVRLPAGTWVNGDLARVWSLPTTGRELLTHLETRISVDNLTDTVLYDQCGLPRPGRLTRSQIRVF